MEAVCERWADLLQGIRQQRSGQGVRHSARSRRTYRRRPDGRPGRILDELGNSLGDVNRRDVLKSIIDVAEQQQVTILGTCQDSILSDASDFFGELIWFTHAAASDAYNQPTRIWCHDQLGERVELTGQMAAGGT